MGEGEGKKSEKKTKRTNGFIDYVVFVYYEYEIWLLIEFNIFLLSQFKKNYLYWLQ